MNPIHSFGLAVALTMIVVKVAFVTPLEEQLQREQAINTYTIGQLNKMSTKAKKLQDRVIELESANEQLITHCTPVSVVRAIKATPLPPMKG